MSLRNGRTHYFHADATGIGGHIERPFVRNIPVQAPTSLAPVGGETDAASADFSFEQIISARTARTRVEGTFLNGLATTRMTAIVEDLNVLDTVRAEQLVAYISSEHLGKGRDVPRIDFGKTRITNLRVRDTILRVHLDLKALGEINEKHFPKRAHLYEKRLWKRAKQDFDKEQGFLACSLVDDIEVVRGKLPAKIVKPNILEIPDFGRVHLAELLVTSASYQLIMMRIELGCPTQGTVSVSSGKVNGGGK